MNDTTAIAPIRLPTDLAVPELLNSLADGAFITDLNRRILCWNEAAERITGWRAVDVVGRSCFDHLLAHVDKEGCGLCGEERCPLHRSIRTGRPSEEPVLVFAVRKGGARTPMEVSVGPLRNFQGQIIGGIEVFRDLSEAMEDLVRAKGIQQHAVESPLPADARVEFEVCYQPRHVVGGDFYRIERHETDQYALMVADAMGHGVAGALCAMQLRSLWDDHREHLDSPARFLGIVNDRVYALSREGGYFATGVCATYNAASGEFLCVRAGHPAPLLFRASGAIEALGAPQLALGLLPECRYLEARAELAPGDAVLFFTDGAIELFDAGERQLGTEGLKRLVQDQHLAGSGRGFDLERLQDQLLAFSQAVQLADDLTLVKLRRKV